MKNKLRETPDELRARLMAEADAYEAQQDNIIGKWRSLNQQIKDARQRLGDCKSQIEGHRATLDSAQHDFEAAFINGSLAMHQMTYAAQLNMARTYIPMLEVLQPKLEKELADATRQLAALEKANPDLLPPGEVTTEERYHNMRRAMAA